MHLLALTAALLTASPPKAPQPTFEVVLSEALLTDLLRAATPLDTTVEQDLAMMGLAQKLRLAVHLEQPEVKIGRSRITVTMKYRVKDQSGFIDVQGVATPEMQIVAVPARQVFEAKLVRSGVKLPSGAELPLERFIEPFILPATSTQQLELGGKSIIAESLGTEVVLETGLVRLRGTTTFRPGPAAEVGQQSR